MKGLQVENLIGEGITDSFMLNLWYPVGFVDNFPENVPVEKFILGTSVVVWKSDGNFYARRNYCPHEGSKFTNNNPKARAHVEGCTIQCGYHGWTYNEQGIATNCPSTPKPVAQRLWNIDVFKTMEAYGLVWVTLGTNPKEIPVFPQWANDSFHQIWAGPYIVESSYGRSILNAGDMSHFAFVHDTTLGDRNHPLIPDYRIERSDETGVIAHDVQVWQPNPDGTGVGRYVSYTYYIPQPHILRFDKLDPSGNCFSIYLAIQPTTEESCVWYMWMAMNYPSHTTDDAIRNFQDVVSQDDIDLLREIRPRKLPLDLKLGRPLIPADHTAITYRQQLTSWGITYGVIPV